MLRSAEGLTTLGVLLLGASLAALASEGGAPAAPLTAEQVAEKAFENLYADDYVQVVEMSTGVGRGRELRRKLQIIRRQSERPGKALLRFLEPFDIRNTAVLVLEKEADRDEMFVYLPAIRSTRRLSAAQRVDSFFGTDLSYEDIEPKRTADYAISAADSESDGSGCRAIELVPKEGVDSSYERFVGCIDPASGVIHWIEFYRGGEKVKRAESDLSTVTTVGERRIPFKVTFTTLASGSRTLLATESYELLGSIPDSLFTTRSLETGDALQDRARASKSR